MRRRISTPAALFSPVSAGRRTIWGRWARARGTKLVINMILAGNRLALAEGLMLGTKVGLEMDTLLEVLKDGACSSKTDDRQGSQDDSRRLLETGPGENFA